MQVTDKNLKRITIFFFICLLFWLIHDAVFYKYLVIYSDELRYIDLNESIFTHGKLLIRLMPSDFQKILYSVVLYPATYFLGTDQYTIAISFINCLLMSTSVFVAYLLGKECELSNKFILFLLLLTVVMPDSMYALTFMSENLYLPLGMATILVGWRCLKRQDTKHYNIILFVFSITCYLLYLTKEIALAIIMAYCVTVLLCLFREFHSENYRNTKKYLMDICAVIGIFFIFFGLIKITFFSDLPNSYYKTFGGTFSSFITIAKYFMAILVVNTTWATLGYFYFPLVYPCYVWKSLDENLKREYLFTIFSFIITVLVVVYTITIREDFPSLTPRQHLRYLCPYFLPLFALFFKSIELSLATQNTNLINRKKFYIAILVFCFAIFALNLRFNLGAPIDQTMLLYTVAALNFKHTISIIPNNELLFKVLVVLFFVSISYFILKKPKVGFSVLFCTILTICFVNREMEQKKLFELYAIQEYDIQKVLEIGDDLKSYNSQVAFVDSEAVANGEFAVGKTCQLLDTFLPNKFYAITLGQLKNRIKVGDAVSNININEIDALFPKMEYLLVDQASDKYLDKSQLCEIKTYPMNLILYKNFSPSQISIFNVTKEFTSGWYDNEKWGRWAKGKTQELRIGLGNNAKELMLALKSFNTPIYVNIYINRMFAKRVLVKSRTTVEHTFILKEFYNDDSDVYIQLIEEGELVSPKSVGVNNDERELGIGLSKIALDGKTIYGK